MQADNLSWFGYPEDPVPSVRATLLPGITQASLLPADVLRFFVLLGLVSAHTSG